MRRTCRALEVIFMSEGNYRERLFSKNSSSLRMFIFKVCLVLYIHRICCSIKQVYNDNTICLKHSKVTNIVQIKIIGKNLSTHLYCNILYVCNDNDFFSLANKSILQN